MVADSPDEVRIRVREQLMRGASQIKLTAGGGVASPNSPLDVITFTPETPRRGRGGGTGAPTSPSTPIPPRRSSRRSRPA